MTQAALFDLEAGRALRNEGHHLLSLAEARDDRSILDGVILHLAQSGRRFSSDDVWPFLPVGIRPNSLGAAFHRFAEAGTIREVGSKQSERPEARARRIVEWQGVAS